MKHFIELKIDKKKLKHLKICKNCGKQILQKAKKKYCSRKCANFVRDEQSKEYCAKLRLKNGRKTNDV